MNETLRTLTARDGHHLAVDSTDTVVAANLLASGEWEPFECGLIAGLLRPGGVAVDGGANVGVHTLTMARAVGPAGRVIAAEPDPANFRLLSANVAANGYAGVVTLANVALAASDGGATLYHATDGNLGDHRTFPGDGRASGVPVPSDTIDRLTLRCRPVDLIKLDCQGYEGHVLAGAAGTLRRWHPTLVMEFWPFALRLAGTDPAELLDRILSHGYEVDVIDEATRSTHLLDFDLALSDAFAADRDRAFNLLFR